MMLMTRNFLLVAVSLLAAGGSAWLTFVRGHQAVRVEDDLQAEYTASIRSDAASVQITAPIAGNEVHGHLAASSVHGEDAVTRAQRRLLAAEAAEFLRVRFDASDADEYASWMRSRGFVPAGLAELRSFWHIDDIYRADVGLPMPDDVTFEDAWRDIWRAASRSKRPRVDLTHAANAPEGYSIAARRITLADPSWPQAPHPPFQALVHSGAVHTSHSWWRHPRAWQEQLKANGSALVAHVVFMARNADGSRGAVCLAFVWDDATGNWLLQSVSTDIPARLEY
ncbi:MAG: hypothetical protein KIS87_00555 [Phycisphaeraceae bacterium]|nr:hypothetical protein [Phycisphaeraceae bacterium]